MSSNHPEPPTRRRYRGPYPAVLITLVLGVVLTVLGSWAIHAWEKERAEALFARATDTITRSIEDCFLHQIDNVRAVAALYEAFPDRIGRTDFRNFVDPLVARCEALLAIAWAPAVPSGDRAAFEARVGREQAGYAIVEYDGAGQLVPASERDLHFPIHRAEPPNVAGYPLGLDLASRPRERETLGHVRRTGRMSFVLHDATPDTQRPTLETLLYPVYRGRRTSSGTAGQDPAGIVVGLSRLTSIVDEALRHAGNPRLGIDILEVLPNGERQAIYARPPDRAERPAWISVLPLTPAIDAREMQLVTADHPLVLRFVPHAGVYGTWPGWLPAAFLIAGLLFTGLVAIYIDHTRSKTERIAELARRLADQDRRKNEFLAVLGHELRNPIAPIGNAVQVLRTRRTPTPATVEWAAGVIERQVSQLARLVDDLLDVARISRGDIALRSELVDLREVVERAIETQRPLIDTKGHLLRERLPPDPVPVRGDRARLIQVVGNLLDNAAKYTPQGGRIDVEVRSDGAEATISVRDSGIGIAPELLPKVFEFFDRIPERERHAIGGLGIGLGLARRLVEMQGGRIEARSAGEGAGSQFTVHLPVSHPSAGEMPVTPRSPLQHVPRRVLVVEDNADVATTFAVLLETLGHEAIVAGDGPAALKVAASFAPEVAFIDIGLPGMDGYELARRLRRRGAPVPYLVALTGYGQARDRERAAMAGFDRHLVKPVDMATLDEVFAALPVRHTQPA